MGNNLFEGTVICSLCLLRRPGEVLLARKQKKLVIGLWNGYGGRQEPGERIRKTASREILEETSNGIMVFPGAMTRIAVMYFHNQNRDNSRFTVKMHVFETWKWFGQPYETDEMITPTWWPDKKLPLAEMPIGDRYWLPQVLAGRKLIGHINYGPQQKTLIGEPYIMIVNDGDLDRLNPED